MSFEQGQEVTAQMPPPAFGGPRRQTVGAPGLATGSGRSSFDSNRGSGTWDAPGGGAAAPSSSWDMPASTSAAGSQSGASSSSLFGGGLFGGGMFGNGAGAGNTPAAMGGLLGNTGGGNNGMAEADGGGLLDLDTLDGVINSLVGLNALDDPDGIPDAQRERPLQPAPKEWLGQ